MTVLGRSLALGSALLLLSACAPRRIHWLDDALDRKAAFEGPFPAALNSLTPRLPSLLAFVNAEAVKRGLEPWPDPWPEWSEAGPKDRLLRKIWVNPKVTWFCDSYMTRWDAVLVMKAISPERGGSRGTQLVLIHDAFGVGRSFSTLFDSPRSLPSGCVTWSHPIKQGKDWISSEEIPAWSLAPYAYPRQTAVLTTPVDVDWFMRFAYSPDYGIALWGGWGMVSKVDCPAVNVVGEDDYFVWEKVDGYQRVRSKDPTMEEMKGPSMQGWTSLP